MHFDGDALPEGVNNFVIFEDDSETADTNERMFEGMFHGVPGTFACTGNNECRAENDADGDLAKLLGTWTFTPKEQEMGDDAYMVAGVVPDDDYLDFGYWIVTTQGEDGPVYTVGTYASAPGPTELVIRFSSRPWAAIEALSSVKAEASVGVLRTLAGESSSWDSGMSRISLSGSCISVSGIA